MLRTFRSSVSTLRAHTSSTRRNYKLRRTDHYMPSKWRDVSDDQLFHIQEMRRAVYRYVPGMTPKSQRGLFHGKRKRSGTRSCFSEKKSIRHFKPNVFKRDYWSELLGRKVKINVSTTAMKKIRYYGGFDNYVMLAHSKNMYSNMGEYLRRVMLFKLRNPGEDLTHRKIMGAEKNCYIKKRSLRQIKNPIYFPAHVRYKDLTHLRPRTVENYSRREFLVYEAMLRSPEDDEEYRDELEVILERNRKIDEEGAKRIPERQRLIDKWVGNKSPKFLKKFNMIEDGVE